MTEKMICEKCGSEMIDQSIGDSICIECPKCGWGWATTTYDPTCEDRTPYEVWLELGNQQTLEILRLIANVAGVNFIQAKTILSSESPVMIYRACPEAAAEKNMVQQIQDVARKLLDAGVQFSIKPDFTYDY